MLNRICGGGCGTSSFAGFSYRQKPLLSFIVDFYCPRAKLVIELDGAQHFEAAYQIRDAERDKQLASIGLKVLRFDDRQDWRGA